MGDLLHECKEYSSGLEFHKLRKQILNFFVLLYSKKLIFFFQNGILEISPDFAFWEKIDHVRTFWKQHTISFFRVNSWVNFGTSPSGKAAVFGTDTRRFESFRPSSIKISFLFVHLDVTLVGKIKNLYLFCQKT